ncbi:MAG: sugar transferase, partial [Bacteroidota bacterium]
NKGQVFFIQERIGYQNRSFRIFKFKTMQDLRDASGQMRPDEERITPLGKWLRKTSLDEVPQIFNILRGEMNVIGPRPLFVSYLERYNAHQIRRHEVKPGITGWAQVNGRNALDWDSRFDLDVWYVDHAQPAIDRKIIMMSFKKLFWGADGDLLSQEFQGKK